MRYSSLQKCQQLNFDQKLIKVGKIICQLPKSGKWQYSLLYFRYPQMSIFRVFHTTDI
jgi:hypothetical protein